MIGNALIVGFGEVGKAHFEVLKRAYPDRIFYKDKDDDIFDAYGNKVIPPHIDLLMIATQCNPADMQPFYEMVIGYIAKFGPRIVDILATTPAGGPIGGHCVVYSATTIPEAKRGPLATMLANYNKQFNAPDKVN